MQVDEVAAVVTGGSSGLGRATARLLIERGACVVIVDLATSEGEQTAASLGPRAQFIAADVTDTDGLNRALDAAEAMGSLRAVVHCAGRGGDRTRIVGKGNVPGDLDSFSEVVRVNLIGTYNVLRLAAVRMTQNEPVDGDRGAFVLTASVAAFDGQIGQTAYSASKAAIHGITLVAARDLASSQIRVNTIAPGIFDTPLLGRLASEVRDSLSASVPHPKRLGEPADFARMAIELLENGYVNGETVRLDGAIRMAPR
jgi:NAD(P)-dependent dehydrogenase (short-subunit alcohol dehydrogenase family)